MLTLYDYLVSGNGYKVRLLLHQLGIPFELVQLDILKGETRTPEFLQKNPNGRIPCLRLDDGTYLWESNAIQCYLAEGTPFLPDDRLERAQVLQWMFFEQYEHEPAIAVARFWLAYSGRPESVQDKLDGWHEQGPRALAAMEQHLDGRDWFV